MNLFRHCSVRLPVVAIGCLAWFAISNHCVLATVQPSPTAPVPSCHGNPEPETPAKPEKESGVECCKILRATLTLLTKAAPATEHGLTAPFPRIDNLFLAPIPSLARPPLELDTGPPGAVTFAESVLQRSILAHAPPSLS
ncbi:MAG TPA: hypothetical protein VM940_08365 [Chthoniobacterales bacterium]|jgi:hypothetical protein|nr:hypothetical protein [Chthoniobacterales bacterium]